MNIKCMLDNVKYSNKPQGAEIAKITKRLVNSQVNISIVDLATALSSGQTFKPSVLSGTKETDWQKTQLFALDFDDGITIDEALNKCTELNILPAFGYTSFSYIEQHHKFRLVFCSDNVVTNYNTALKFQLTLMQIFSECDIKCKNLSRLYFGGKKLIYQNYDNRINVNNILNQYPLREEIKPSKITSKPSNINVSEKTPRNNNIIYNTHILYRGEKPRDTLNTDKYYNIKALKERNADYLRNKIGNPHIVFENNEELYNYIFKEVDLGKLLEYQYPKSIKCLFHEDSKPSASIFKNNAGVWIYHCFGCGISYNLLNIVEVLGGFKSRPKAYKFIREIFNIEIKESEWQREQKEILIENMKVLTNGELEKNCPTTYKNIKRNIPYLQQMLLIAIDNVKSDKFIDGDDNVVFFASNKFICSKTGLNENSNTEVSKKNALFAYHNLLNKVDDSEINEDLLKRSQAIGANSVDKNKKYRHVNYYSIPSYTTSLFPFVEEKGQQWKENNYSMKGLSREMFYRAEGKEIADKIYPQYKKVIEDKQIVDRTTTQRSNDMTDKIIAYIFQCLEDKKYCMEDEIIGKFLEDDTVKITKTTAGKQIKKSIAEILNTYNLQRIRCNKLIKEQYGITDLKGYPFIIVQK